MAQSGNNQLAKLKRALEQESNDSIALLNNAADNPICTVRYDDELPGIFVQWRNYATSSQLRFIHEYIIHLLEQHRVQKILGDDTALLTIHSSDQEWITLDWMPRAKRAGFRAAAAKRPTGYFGHLATSSVQTAVASEIEVRSFSDLSEARTWLRSVKIPPT
jgi:hypothetical protein